MKEIKNIDQLFKAAKEETPQRTFEEVSQKFEHSLKPNTTIDVQTYLSNFNLLIMAVITTALAVALFWGFPLSTESVTDPASNPITQLTKTIELQKNNYDTIASIPAPTPEEIVLSKPIERPSEPTITATSKTLESKNTLKRDTKEIITNTSTVTMLSENDSPKKRDTPLVASSSINDHFIESDTLRSSTVNLATQTIKPSNPVTVPTEVNQSKDVLITPSNPSKITKNLLLSKRNKGNELASFVKGLQAYGLETKIELLTQEKGMIKKITLQLAHPKGLEWEIKLKAFDYLEIKFLLNEKEEIEGITYRLNQVGDFADFLTLRHKAKSFHKFGKKGTRHRHTKKLN